MAADIGQSNYLDGDMCHCRLFCHIYLPSQLGRIFFNAECQMSNAGPNLTDVFMYQHSLA